MNIYFDDAGSTGNNLLDSDQPVFCYLGVISSATIENEVEEIRKKHGYKQGQYMKGASLCGSPRGQSFLIDIWTKFRDMVKFVASEKRLALAAMIFHYTYGTVFEDEKDLLKQSRLGLFFAHLFFGDYVNKIDKRAEELFARFNTFVKCKDNTNISSLVINMKDDGSRYYVFNDFCKQHINDIGNGIDFTRPFDGWLFDLTATGLYSLLCEFSGNSSEQIHAFCDKSKSLLAQLDALNKLVADGVINLNLATSVTLLDSKTSESIQLADYLVSSVYHAVMNSTESFSMEIINIASKSIVAEMSFIPSYKKSPFSKEETEIYWKLLKELSLPTDKNTKVEALKKYCSSIVELKQQQN